MSLDAVDAAVVGDVLDFLEDSPPKGVRGLFVVDQRLARFLGRDSGYEFTIIAEHVDPRVGECLCPECWEAGAAES